MNNNLFWYTTEEGKIDLFNLDCVVRGVTNEKNNGMIIVLDDQHEEIQPQQVMIKGKMEIQMRKSEVCSYIELNEEDANKFRSLSGYVVPEVVEEKKPSLILQP